MLCKGKSSMPLLQPHDLTREVCRVSIGEPVVVRAGEERLIVCSFPLQILIVLTMVSLQQGSLN